MWLEIASSSTVTRIIVDDVVADLAPSESPMRLATNLARVPASKSFVGAALWWKRHRRFGLPPRQGPDSAPVSERDRLLAR